MTVDEKRKLELKTMYQIIGIYCHNKHHTPKGSYVRLASRFGNMRSIVLMHVLIWKVKHSVVYVKLIAMHLIIVKKSVKLCVYGGPRMLLVSPIQVIRHMYLEWKDKKRG